MQPELQRALNSVITQESYQRLRDELDGWLGMKIQYRVAEMPILVSKDLRIQMEDAAISIIKECVGDSQEHPLFSVVDFAICEDNDGKFIPRLIELQGFPSLFGYQLLLCKMYKHVYGVEYGTPFLSNLDEASYLALLRQSIFAEVPPTSCALVEVDPFEQKTLPDFIATQKYLGLPIVNIRDVQKIGKKLYAPVNGQLTHLERIFNRAIVDELDDLGVSLPFTWDEELDVTWAGDPHWYFKISKNSMPALAHSSVPKSTLLSEIDSLPLDLHNYVLKPLYAFAGKGVVVGPTENDVLSVPHADKSSWILQERVVYADCVPTPLGNNRVEIRVMNIWPEHAANPIPVISLARTGRGLLMGARYNTDPWTGSSGCLFC